MTLKPTTMQTLRRFALRLPETVEGVACAGTALESHTVKRKNKAFIFLRVSEVRLKLAGSIKEATAIASQDPKHYAVGANGWVQVRIDGDFDQLDVLKRWIEESYSLLGGSKSPSTKSNVVSRKAKTKSAKVK